MNKIAKGSLIGCGGIIAILAIAVVALVLATRPGQAPPHRLDGYRMNAGACLEAFEGRNSIRFDHIWILKSPDLQAWWGPNAMRAEAKLLLDSDDREIIQDIVACAGSAGTGILASGDHGRTRAKGRIYHVLLFDHARREYAHLRFSCRSKQADGTTVFSLITAHDGATPVKDCPKFLDFEKRRLSNEKPSGEQDAGGKRDVALLVSLRSGTVDPALPQL